MMSIRDKKGKEYGRVPSHQSYIYEWLGFKTDKISPGSKPNRLRIHKGNKMYAKSKSE